MRQSRIAPFNSDGASNVLQADAMLHGNLLLRGWWISDVSFYTTELPEYVLVEAFRGLRPDVVHICGALTYTLLLAAASVWLAAGLAALCFAASRAPMGPPNQELANWLLGHHDTEGLAGYWQADATTVASGGKVLVAPITYQATGVRRWESSAIWYEPSHRRANFAVAVTDPSAGQPGKPTAAARRSFGRPAFQYQVGRYVVMVYNYNLLTRLSGRARA